MDRNLRDLTETRCFSKKPITLTMSARSVPCHDISRALIIKLRHLGDVLLTSPVFSALKHAAPQCEIDALIYDECIDMLSGHPDIAEIHTIRRNREKQGALAQAAVEWALFRKLKLRKYDLIVHLTDSWRGAWLARFLRPRYSAALFSALHPPPKFWTRSFTHLAPSPPLGNRHTVECHLDALRALGIHPSTKLRKLSFHIGATDRLSVRQLLADRGVFEGCYIHIHPTSRWLFKAWTVDGYAELIARLNDLGYQVVLTAGPSPREMALAASIVQRCRVAPIDLAGQLTLKQLGAVIASARLSICIDSAPMHMAAALGTPVIALFGPSNEHEWGPWQVPHRIIHSDHACRPCRLDGCGGGKISECLTELNVATVMKAIESLLSETM